MFQRRFLLLLVGTMFAGLALQGNFQPRNQIPTGKAQPGARSSAQVQLPDIQLTGDQVVGSGYTRPVQVTGAGDGSGRMFVVEQTGAIRILENGQTLPAPFLSLSVAWW